VSGEGGGLTFDDKMTLTWVCRECGKDIPLDVVHIHLPDRERQFASFDDCPYCGEGIAIVDDGCLYADPTRKT